MKYVIVNSKATTRDEMLNDIAKAAVKQGVTTSPEKLVEAFLKREAEGTTGFENEIAIPHARIKEIVSSAIIIARNKNGVEWPSLDGKKTTTAISLCIEGNESAGNEHMRVLSAVASLLISEENANVFKNGKAQEIEDLVDAKLNESQEPVAAPTGKGFDIVAISTCPTGVAHTNMAAEAMIEEAKKQGLSIKVERQAAEGIVNGLTEDDIKNARVVVLAAGKQIEGTERFVNKKVWKVDVAAPIKSAKKVFADAFEKAEVMKPTRRDTAKQAMSSDGGAKPMQALMNGVSYMIPFVIVGGILIALALGIGGHKSATGGGLETTPGSFWDAVLGVGAVGFTIMIPILGGFIASAIAGRAALAPGMIISFVIGNQDGQLFNWEKLEFGHFDESAKLGFLGAIAAGFLVGYLVKLWRATLSPRMPKMLKPVEPIIFIPMVMVIVGWAFFAFAGYLPLYYISWGLNKGVTYLIDNNLFVLAAIILGAMVAFDMGGPVNKIAFLIGGGFISQGKPEVMGAVAAAIAVPPLGTGLGVLFGKYVFKKSDRFDDQDRGNAISAIFMSMVGITEGAIPFAVKYPKQVIIANVLGGAIGAGLAAVFSITDNAQHGGAIVYILGAVGKDGLTNYLWGLFFLASIAIGGLATAFTMNLMFDVPAIKAWFVKAGQKTKSAFTRK